MGLYRPVRLLNWETLRHLGVNRREPWICVGDFNEIASHSKKVGGRRKDQFKIDCFTSLNEDIHMEDMGFKGQMHTWSNNRRGNDRIMERLDRVLANLSWCLKFSKAQCVNGLAIGSDHSPVELILNFCDSKGRRRFRFEQMWLERRECFDIIKGAWESTGSVSSARDLEPKLSACRRALIHWSRSEFKNNVKEINKAR